MADVRIRFSDNEKDIEEYLNKKTSKAGFIKDLIRIEMQREYNYINGNVSNYLTDKKDDNNTTKSVDFSDILI